MGSAPTKITNSRPPVTDQLNRPAPLGSDNKDDGEPSISHPAGDGSGGKVTHTPPGSKADATPGDVVSGQPESCNAGGGEVGGRNEASKTAAGEVGGRLLPGRPTQTQDFSGGQVSGKFSRPTEHDKNPSGEVTGKVSKPESMCDNCSHSDGRNKAGFCILCVSFMCEACLVSHNTANRDHIVLDPSSMPVNKSCITDNNYGLCVQHETESYQYFCASHNTDCCKICLEMFHRLYNGVKHRSKQILHEQRELQAGSDFFRANTIIIVRPKRPAKPCKCRYESSISVRHANDSARCDVTGSAVFDSNFLVVADNWNSSVKMIDVNKREIVSYLRLSMKPWDVTKVLEKYLVVTCSLKLIMIDVALKSLKLTAGRSIRVKGQYRGITYSKKNKCLIVSSIGTEPAVTVMKIDGTVLQTFTVDENKQHLFANPEYVTIIENNEENEAKIMVSDSRNNTVTCLNMDGAVLGSYINDRLKNPKGLAIDDTGSTLVAGWGSETVERISDKCDQIQTILKKDDIITYPQSVSICRDTNLVFISHYHYQSTCNFISVYKILRENND